MSTFNFGSLATTQATSNSQPRLKPWSIYTVKFAGARIDEVKGKKDPNAVYQILKVRFENDEGYYEESIFFPKDGDDKRPTYTNSDGHEYQGASSFERIMAFIAQVATVLNPSGFEKMQAMSSKFKSFDEVAKAFIQVTSKAVGTETKLKLIGRTSNGNIEPALPKFVTVNSKGEVYTCDNFLGDKVFFKASEEKRMQEMQNAKATNMDKVVVDNPTNDTTDEIDFSLVL